MNNSNPITDDNQSNNAQLHNKHGKRLEPLRRHINTQSHEDLLAELRKKTDQLAQSIDGENAPPKKTLIISQAQHAKNNTNTEKIIAPSVHHTLQKPQQDHDVDHAAEIVRRKLAHIYRSEPDAQQEVAEVSTINKSSRSKHQEYMAGLSNSGRSPDEIQRLWHSYYASLTDEEKREVWNEFYANQHSNPIPNQHATSNTTTTGSYSTNQTSTPAHTHKLDSSWLARNIATQKEKYNLHPKKIITRSENTSHQKHIMHPATKQTMIGQPQTLQSMKAHIIDKVNAGGMLSAKHHAKSLLFGLSMSGFVVLLLSAVFFNEAYVAPFISPGRNVSATPIIPANDTQVGPESKIIIPKINVEIPVVYDTKSVDEQDVQNNLENGVVHYATTPNPGEIGNSVIVGHSSNNILNKGKYKFAFVLLRQLESEDVFYIHKNNIRYTYKVYKKEVVKPSDLHVLQTQEKANTITLITCDPPGTSLNRLAVTAEQISPDPASNAKSTALTVPNDTQTLPSNAPSLWSRMWPF